MGRAVYVISVAAELAGVHPQTLRVYERRGLVDPLRTGGGSRRYSERDLERLRRIQDLTAEGLNLEGVRKVLVLEAEVERLQAELDACQVRSARDRRADAPPVQARPRAAAPAAGPRLPCRQPAVRASRLGWSEEITVALDPNRWTLRTQQAVNAAGAQARSLSQAEVTPNHLLAAILAQPEGIAVPLLARAGVDTPRAARSHREKPRLASRRPTAPTSRPCRARAATFSSPRTHCARTWATSTCRSSTCCSRCPTCSVPAATSCWRRCARYAAATG